MFRKFVPLAVALVGTFMIMGVVGASGAAAAGPVWSVDSFASPSVFSTSLNKECGFSLGVAGCDTYTLTATNVGAGEGNAKASVVLYDVVEPGLVVQGVTVLWSGLRAVGRSESETVKECTTTPEPTGATRVKCKVPASFLATVASGHARVVKADDQFKMLVSVSVEEPTAVAVNPGNGDVVVLNEAANRVETFNEKGEFQQAFGSEGTGNGQFKDPRGLTIDAKGDIWVADSGNDRVEELSESGEYLGKFGAKGAGDGQLEAPSDLALASNGDVYLADTGNDRVEELGAKGEYLGQFGAVGAAGGQFDAPTGLALDAKGDVLVTDSANNRVQELTSSGQFIRAWGAGVITAGASGTGDLATGSDEVTSVITTEKAFLEGQTVTGSGIPAGTTITKVTTGVGAASTLTLSNPVTETKTGDVLTVAEGAGNVPTNDQQTLAVKATGGTFKLGFETTSPTAAATTGVLAFNATAATVQAALEALPNIGAGNVKVTGGPGDETGSTPYTVTFQGALADTKVAALSAESADLTNSSDTKGTATAVITQEGASAFEVCTEAVSCIQGVASGLPGGMSTPGAVVVEPAGGDAYVTDTGDDRVEKFGEKGEYLSQFGTNGGGDGQLNGPKALALDGKGDVLVLDSGNDRVESFSEGGEFLSAFGAYESSTLKNEVTVEGGGAEAPKTETFVNALGASGAPEPSFGLSGFTAPLLGSEGVVDSQAGAHPYELSAKFDLSTVFRDDPEANPRATSVQDLRDVVFDLPLGLAGSAIAVPQCTLSVLVSKGVANEQGVSGCPADTILGHLRTYPEGFVSADTPVYNIVPEHGVAAEFGFVDNTGASHVLYGSIAPTPAGYVLRSTTREIPQVLLGEIAANVYGDPAARGRSFATEKLQHFEGKEEVAPYAPAVGDVPMFTNPEDCSGDELEATVHIDSWQAPGSYNADGTPDLNDPNWVTKTSKSPAVTGCGLLEFNPSIAATPEQPQAGGTPGAEEATLQADSPMGLQVNLKVPQTEGPETLATPPLKDATVTLPEGVTVNPSQANGLQACSEEQIGWQGKSSVASGEYENFNASPPACPEASKIGTVEIESPDLSAEGCKVPGKALSECAREEPVGSSTYPEREPTPLHGSIYVADQYANPFGSLLAVYIAVDDPRTGVVVKLPGEIKLNPATGQLTSTFDDTPQFPFSELRTHFFGGNDASLKTPSGCGAYTLTSVLEPWSHQPAPGEAEGTPDATPSSTFQIEHGAGGGSCSSPFAPSFKAETTPTAGAYTPLTVHLNREDGTQNISGLNITLPPGLTGKIAGIPQCSEAQIAAAQARSHPGEGAAELASPSCPSASEVGTVTVGAGAGEHPYYVTGHVYFAGPYKGAPFSLAIVTPAVAGPFDLGVIVVRAGLYINPITTQVTTKSDPIPQMINNTGIPTDVRSITVNISHNNEFIINPTSCTPASITGEAISATGQVAPLSDRIAVGGCEDLKFAPKFTVSTSGRTSKALGASLTTKITYPAPYTSYANIAKVKVELPKQLPSQLKTLQKACTAAQFEANPAGCPPESVVGHATAVTPILSVPLTGPAIFVSHGNEAFPSLTMVLQGDGVTIDLVGSTLIKNGITSTTFKTVPDQPVNSFELTLPQGKYSALTANGDLCTSNLEMPTEFIAQNGAEIHESTKIEVEGCSNALSVVSSKIKKRTVTLAVYAPGAGKVTAGGKGVSSGSKTYKGREALTFTLKEKKTGKLKTRIKLTFTPKTGKKQVKSLSVKFAKPKR
jgi:hypothetical protein